MYKYSATIDDAGRGLVGNTVGSVIPVVNQLLAPANLVGLVIGMTLKTPTDKLLGLLDKDKNLSWVPPVASYRMAKRRKALAAKSGHLYMLPISLHLGGLTSSLPLVALGAILGGVAGGVFKPIKNSDPLQSSQQETAGNIISGVGIGALTGGIAAGGASALGALIAAIKRRRTLQLQKQYDASTGQALANYLIPGRSTYNYWKSVGASIGSDLLRSKKKKR